MAIAPGMNSGLPEIPASAATEEPRPFSSPLEVSGTNSETRMVPLPSKAKPRPSEVLKEAPEVQFPVVRAMKDGQNLFRLTGEVYGRTDPRLIEWVIENNPWISDVTKIPNGKEIVFPEPPEGQ